MRASWVAAFAALTVSLACGDGNGPNRSELAGIWDATKLEFTNTANTAEKVDIIALGGSFVILLESNGDYQATMGIPGVGTENTTGTWSVSSDVFTLKESGFGGTMQFDYNLNGNTLTIAGADSEFDFDGDDVPEGARVSAVLVRQ